MPVRRPLLDASLCASPPVRPGRPFGRGRFFTLDLVLPLLGLTMDEGRIWVIGAVLVVAKMSLNTKNTKSTKKEFFLTLIFLDGILLLFFYGR